MCRVDKGLLDEDRENPALEYYPDPDADVGMHCWMCGWKSEKADKLRSVWMHIHIRRKDHKWKKKRSHLSERRDIVQDKLEIARTVVKSVLGQQRHRQLLLV